MEEAFAVQIGHAAGCVTSELHPRLVGQRCVTRLYQLLQAAAVYVLCEGVQLALVHAYAYEPGSGEMTSCIRVLM